MKQYIAAFAGTSIVMVSLDMLWLGIIATPLYRQGIGHLMADSPDIGVALLQRGLAALQAQGIDKCHLLVFRDNADGMAFWRSVGASERTELSLFSMSIDPVGQALP